MTSGNPRMDWQHGAPPPHRGHYSPYDSPSPYEGQGHPQPPPAHDNRPPPYGGGYHGYCPGPGPPPPHMMSPRNNGGPPPPHDYWSYDQAPPTHQAPPPRRPPPPSWHPGPSRGAPQPHDSPGAPYDHRMGPPPLHHRQQEQQGYPYPGPQRHASHPYSPRPHPQPYMGGGRPPPGPCMPDVHAPPPHNTNLPSMRGPRDLSMRGPPPLAHTPPRGGIKSETTAFGTPVRSNVTSPKLSTPVAKKPQTKEDQDQEAVETPPQRIEGRITRSKMKGKGDPLSLLAKVCKQESEEEPALESPNTPAAPSTPAPIPTSPALRRLRPSPVVTPASTPMGKVPLMPHPNISPVDSRAEGGYWASEAGPDHFRRTMSRDSEGDGAGRSFASPPQHASRQAPLPYGSGPPPTAPGPYPDWQNDSPTPNLVERGSFDSVDARDHGYDARRGGPGHFYGGGGPGEYPPQVRPPAPYAAQRQYPPPRWSSYPPDPNVRGPYPPPPHDMSHQPHPMEHSSRYPPSQVTPSGQYPPEGRHYPPPHSLHPPPQSHQYSHGPPTPMRRHDGGPPPVPSMTYAPYTYVQQPHLEEKTILRKKFSWKHYPELERFLIASRDDYLKHSNMNYTAEQKQYNNWLTERLLEVAAEHHYAFDPEEFNFVAIRDRIRCYYKSYVQTARKRGLNLPTKLEPVLKKARTESNAEETMKANLKTDFKAEAKDDNTKVKAEGKGMESGGAKETSKASN